MTMQEWKNALDEAQSRFHVPSYSATIYHKGQLFSFSGGQRDLENGLAADDQTLYAIGSCTKSFVAGAVCTLADRGLLRLDDTIRDHIPEFEMFDPYVSQHLTVRDMLCHRCGLPRHEMSWYARLDVLTEEDIIRMFRYLRPNQPFRYKWQYSNQMFALAGFLIRRLTGKTWQQVVRENIWEPLGITRAAFSPKEAQALGNCAVPYLYDKEKNAPYAVPHADIGAMGSAGSIYMATSELIKWDRMLLSGGVWEGRRVLSEEMCREMTSPQMIRPGEEDASPLKPLITNCGYGLGLMTEVFRGHRFVHHGGHIDGFMADQSFLQDDDYACAILTNLGEIRGAQVMRYVAAEHALEGGRDWSVELEKFFDDQAAAQKAGNDALWAKRPRNAPCPVPLDAIAGTYREDAYGTITIRPDGENLAVHLGTAVLTAVHYANNYFYLEAPHLMPGVLMEACVDIDAQGNVTGFSAGLDVEGPEKIHFVRQGGEE